MSGISKITPGKSSVVRVVHLVNVNPTLPGGGRGHHLASRLPFFAFVSSSVLKTVGQGTFCLSASFYRPPTDPTQLSTFSRVTNVIYFVCERRREEERVAFFVFRVNSGGTSCFSVFSTCEALFRSVDCLENRATLDGFESVRISKETEEIRRYT
mgnify:CR=1 FL=1